MPRIIPVLKGPTGRPETNGWDVRAYTDLFAQSTGSVVEHPQDVRRATGAAMRGRRPQTQSRNARALRVHTFDGPASVCAALLAGMLDAPLQIFDGTFGDEGAEDRTLDLVVGLPGHLTDEVLFRLLGHVRRGLRAEVPWDRVPQVSILTARDLPALSWLIARILASAGGQAGPQAMQRIAYYEFPGASAPVVREIRRKGGGRRAAVQHAETTIEGAEDVLASYLAPSNAIVVATHGFEACAEGGEGVVLCGRHRSGRTYDADAPGVLACGRGLPCPRGPHPIPLRELQTPVLMLASCNSFRLGGSQLDSDFNLGLSFVDGKGESFVSSPATITHAQPSGVAFAAAMASGRSVAEATTLVNGLLECAGIDQPTFVSIGRGDYRIAQAAGRDPARVASLPAVVDAGDAHHAEIVVSDERAIALAREGRLALDLGLNESHDRIYYFHRLERKDDDRSAAVLRCFVFSFPRPLGRLRLAVHDAAELRANADRAVEAALFWQDFARLAGLDGKIAHLPTLGRSVAAAREQVASLLTSIAFDGASASRIVHQTRVMASLATMTRDLATDSLMTNVSGSFLLSTLWSDEFRNVGESESPCANCGGRAFHRVLRHTLRDHGRIVMNCWRCGYVADIPRSGTIRGVSLEAPELAVRGKPFVVRVKIDAGDTPEPSELRVWVRINGQQFGHLTPDPGCGRCELDGNRGEVSFTFALPETFPPHGYAIRALVVSPNEVAAAARGFFVAQEDVQKGERSIWDRVSPPPLSSRAGTSTAPRSSKASSAAKRSSVRRRP